MDVEEVCSDENVWGGLVDLRRGEVMNDRHTGTRSIHWRGPEPTGSSLYLH